MCKHKHLLTAAALACVLLASGHSMAAGAANNNAAADARLLGHIPANAQAVVIIHDMGALDKKVALLAQKLKIPVLPPSLRNIEKKMNLPRGIDAHGTAAIVEIASGTMRRTTYSVMMLPTRDPKAAIANMNFSAGKDGLAHGQSADGRDIYAMAGRHCILVSHNRGALLQFKSVSAALTPMLTASEQPLAASSDVCVLVNVPAIRKPIEQAMANAGHADIDATGATGETSDGSELKTIAEQVGLGMVKDTHSALLALRISPAAITTTMVADVKANSHMDQVLDCLRPLSAKPLRGLPNSTHFIEAAASNINGPLAAALLEQWATAVRKAAAPRQAGSHQFPAVLQQVAALLKLCSQSNTLVNVSAKATGPIMSSVGLAQSPHPAALAALVQHLLVSEARWLSKFQLTMGTALPYRTTVVPHQVTIAAIPFTVIKQSMVLPAAGTSEERAMREAMKMQQSLLGFSTQTYFIGSNDQRLIVGGNCSHKLLAATIHASAARSDPLESNPEIVAAEKHVLGNSSLIMYQNWSAVISAMTQRVKAMAKMNSPMPQMQATEPMSISMAVKNHTLTGRWRMPMANLEQLSARIHALLPLVMMLEMQAMQGDQGGNPQ
ncbi:MAG: hypothetical protein ACP5I8_05410 [Phycisphaerae bacterium]